jgi:Flp pilus assembly protein TadD
MITTETSMSIRTPMKTLSVLCAATLLVACAELSGLAPAEPAAARRADDAYARGRQQHLARRYADALRSYQAALAVDEAHVNARNGLATLYAEQGDFAQAIPIWRALTQKASLASGPGTAFLFGNLGYAYFLRGDYDNAQAALEKACLLDPLNHRAWQHLGEALQKLGQDERAQQMFRQASALHEHDFRADYAVARGGAGVAAIETAVQTTPRVGNEWASTSVEVAADGMLELRRIPAARTAVGARDATPVPAPALASAPVSAPAPAPVSAPALAPAPAPALASAPALAPAPAPAAVPALASAPAAVPARALASAPAPALALALSPAPAPAHSPSSALASAPSPSPSPSPSPQSAQWAPDLALLEIRNGNGVTGMAKRLSRQMGDSGLKVVRLTNEKGFNVRRTRVEYQPPFRAAAERLAERFGSATVVQVDNVKSSNMRLVIGRDLIRPKFALRPLPRSAPTLAVLAEPDKAG